MRQISDYAALEAKDPVYYKVTLKNIHTPPKQARSCSLRGATGVANGKSRCEQLASTSALQSRR